MLRRFSSRPTNLFDEFLKPRLTGARRYDRIAGYFQSSLLELASESLTRMPRIRIVCNTEVSAKGTPAPSGIPALKRSAATSSAAPATTPPTRASTETPAHAGVYLAPRRRRKIPR